MDTLRANSGVEYCPHKNPLRGSISGPSKLQGPKSLQVAGTLQDSGPSLQVSKPHGHMADESGAKGAGKKPWWAPIFKFSAEGNDCRSDGGGRATKAKDRRATVFTDEKARLLRRESRATETWHDLMYHSAIASRMAFPDDDSSSSS